MRKNPWVAAILSFFLGGLGQLILKKYARAGFFFLMELLTGAIFLFGYYRQNTIVESTGRILNLVVSTWAAMDAYKIAKKISKSQAHRTIPKQQKDIYI